MKKVSARILLIVVLLAMTALACVGGGVVINPQGSHLSSAGMQATVSANATATYGAEQFNIQLTAMAGGSQASP